MKRALILFSAFLFALSLHAESFVISGYTFNISGKTRESVIEKLVVPDGEERFETEDDLSSALEAKLQTLKNLRVFRNVEYETLTEASESGEEKVFVTFTIEDARTFLIVPYPKYDTNVGAIIGVKAFESNLMGALTDFSSTFRVIFPPESFGKPGYDGNFSLTDLKLGKATLSTYFEGDTSDSSFKYELSGEGIPLGWGAQLNASFSVKRVYDNYRYTVKADGENIMLGSVSFLPSLDALIHYDRVSSYITPSIRMENVTRHSLRFDFSDYFKLKEKKGSDGVYSFRPYEAAHTTALSFLTPSLFPYSFSNTLRYRFDDYFDVDNTFFYRLSDITTLMAMENIRLYKEKSVTRFDSGVGISQEIRIGSHISLRPTLSEFLRIEKEENGTVLFKRYYVISASTSGNYINWKGNFRDGISYNIRISESWMQEYGTRRINEDTGVNDHIDLSIHKIFWSWFNPSFRLTLNYVSEVDDYGSIEGSDDYSLGEYLRGIRNVSTEGYDKNIIGIAASLNLMSVLPLPPFLSFADAYINFFVDYGVAKPKEGVDARNFCGFGIEGIGVLKSYPSYPVRASFGLDLEKLMKRYRGEAGSEGFYEIYIGLGFFF